MNNAEFWASINGIIADGFTPEGLQKLDSYAEQFISGRLVYQRFSPREQHGCAEGGATHVIASILAGAKTGTDSEHQTTLGDFKRECQLGAQQEAVIEQWAKRVYCWYDNVDQFLAVTFGFDGSHVCDNGIADFVQKLGFSLINPKNWTYATPDIYLSDLHDENVIRSKEGNIFVVDCDIRINTPELKCGGTRNLTTDVELMNF